MKGDDDGDTRQGRRVVRQRVAAETKRRRHGMTGCCGGNKTFSLQMKQNVAVADQLASDDVIQLHENILQRNRVITLTCMLVMNSYVLYTDILHDDMFVNIVL